MSELKVKAGAGKPPNHTIRHLCAITVLFVDLKFRRRTLSFLALPGLYTRILDDRCFSASASLARSLGSARPKASSGVCFRMSVVELRPERPGKFILIGGAENSMLEGPRERRTGRTIVGPVGRQRPDRLNLAVREGRRT